MYGGSAHSGYHAGGHRPEYSPVLSAYHGAQDGRPNLGRDLLPDARVPAAALTPEQTEEFRAALGHLSLRDFHEIYQMMHSEVPTAIANYAPLGTLGGTMGGALDMSMPNSGNFLRPIPDAIKQDQDPRSMSIIQLIESGTLTPGELMVLCDVMHNEQIQKMMETLNPAELAARGNFTINSYAIEKLQQRLFPDNPFALSDRGEKEKEEQERLEAFAAACEDMNRTEAQKAWDAQMHRIGDMEFSGAELHAMWKYMNDPANDEEIIDAIMADDPGISREEAKKRRNGAKHFLDLLEKERKGTITAEERKELEKEKQKPENQRVIKALSRVKDNFGLNNNSNHIKYYNKTTVESQTGDRRASLSSQTTSKLDCNQKQKLQEFTALLIKEREGIITDQEKMRLSGYQKNDEYRSATKDFKENSVTQIKTPNEPSPQHKIAVVEVSKVAEATF